MPTPRGLPSFAQHLSGRTSSQDKNITTPSNNVNSNNNGGHVSANSSHLPVIFTLLNSTRESFSSVQPSAESRRGKESTTTDLLQVVEQQRRDLQARTDSVNAIQRNFERLSEMYRDDRVELERLREEVERLRKRNASGESERKVYAAIRAEMESLIQSHKELQDTRRQEQEAFNCRMEEMQRLVAQAKDELDELRRSTADREEKLRRAVSSTNGLTQKVLQFVSEVQSRVKLLPVEGLKHNNNNDNSNSMQQHGASNKEPGEDDTVGVINSALTNAWDSIDAVCIALRHANLSVKQMVEQRVEKHTMVLCKFMQEFERTVRAAIYREEVACRETLYAERRSLAEKKKGQHESSCQQKVREELTLAQRRLQSQQTEHDAALLKLGQQLVETKKHLETAQRDLTALREKHDKDEAMHSERLEKQRLKWNEEKQQLMERHEVETATHESTLTSSLQLLREQHALALEQERKSLGAEYDTKIKFWQSRAEKLEEEHCHLKTLLQRTQDEMKEVQSSNMQVCDGFRNSLSSRMDAQREMLLQYETTMRGYIVELETAEHQMILNQISHCCENSSKDVAVAEAMRRVALQNEIEAKETSERFSILLDACVTSSPFVEAERCLAEARLREASQCAVRATQAAMYTSLKAMQTELRALVEEKRGIAKCLDAMVHDQSRLSSEVLKHVQQLQLECAACASLLTQQRQEQQKEGERQRVVRSVKKVVQRLVAAGEATESAYSCGLCLRLCCRPLTCAPCGHTFCEPCLLQCPQNRGRGRDGASYCPECRLATCTVTVRVRALEVLLGNFSFRQKEIEEMQRLLAMLA